MTPRLAARLLAFSLLGTSPAGAQAARKPYCYICNDSAAIQAEREKTGSCAGHVGTLEKRIKSTERDQPEFDLTPHRALLEQCKADVLREQERFGAAAFPDSVERLFRSHPPDDCINSPSGQCMFDLQFGQLNAERSVALIKEESASPFPDTAARFQKAKAKLDQLPTTLAPSLDRVANLAKTALTDATRFRKDSLVVSEDLCQRGLRAANIVLLFNPQHAEALKQKAALETLLAGLVKEREAFYETAFHKQNLGKVLLIKDLSKIASENAADFQTSFKAGEPLNAAVYFKYPTGMLSGDVAATSTVVVAFESDGKVMGKASWMVAPDEAAHRQAWTSFVAMPAEGAEVADLYTTSDLATALVSLPEGKHQVKVTVSVLNADGSKGVEAASTTFEYDTTTGLDKAKGLAEGLAGKVLDEARMPKAALKDAKLEKAMLAQAADNEFGDKPLRLVITDKAFTITRNWLGAILRRSIHTAIATKGKDGTCMVRRIEFAQQYEGKGYGAPVASYPSDEYPIRCENVKK